MQNRIFHENERLTASRHLRDLFNAQNATELKIAFDAFSLPLEIDEETLEALFNRYFVGPMEPLADPFASVYLESEGAVMGESTLHIRNLYATMGFVYPMENTIPEDHIGVELDAYYQLIYLEEVKHISYLRELRHYFLHEHLAVWVPLFIERARRGDDESSRAIHLILNELESFLTKETTTTRSFE